MKKVLFIIAASLMLVTASHAKAGKLLADFFIGWDGAQQNFSANTAQTTYQMGMGVGGRLFLPFGDDFDIGVAAGFSHIETHWDISGNIGYLSFLLKYHFTDSIEAFGGLGAAMRGTPTYAGTTTDLTLTGGTWNIGVAFMLEEGWRIEAMYSKYDFSGTVNNLAETVTSHVTSVHVGKTIDFK